MRVEEDQACSRAYFAMDGSEEVLSFGIINGSETPILTNTNTHTHTHQSFVHFCKMFLSLPSFILLPHQS